MYVGVDGASTNLIFFTNSGTERARIDSSGNLLVGSATKPLTSLRMYVQGADTSSSAYTFLAGDSSQNTLLYIRNDGLMVTGTQASSPYNNTTATAANMVVTSTGQLQRSTSALKYKQDIRDLESIDINLFRPVRYKSNCANDDQAVDHFGIVADEVDTAGIKELVNYGADGEVEGFQYERLTVVLLKTIQEQQALITQLKADVAALKGN
jgi:hypothetical protein